MRSADSIERELLVPVSLNQAWGAIATPAGLSSWFCTKAQFTPVIDEDMNLAWDGIVIPTRVEKIAPSHEFAFRWMVHGTEPGESMTVRNSTLITFRLEEMSNGTRIIMHESGFASLAAKYHGLSRPEHEQGLDRRITKVGELFIVRRPI